MAGMRLRFSDLRKRNIIKTWPTLKRRVAKDGFPPGEMTGPNERSWDEEEVDEWLKSRPTEGPEPRGAAKAKRDRRHKAADSTDNTATTA
jgi:hypothetical protein